VALVDWVILGFVFLVAIWGFRQGLIVGIFGLSGLMIGVVLGSRATPLLLESGTNSPYTPLFALLGAVLGGTLALGIAISLGDGLRSFAVRGPFGRLLDGAGGAVLAAAIGIGIVWIVGAAIVFSAGQGDLRNEVRRSTLLARINGLLPPSGPLIQAIYKIDPFPRVATSPGEIAAPESGVGRASGVRQAALSVVRVSGVSCGVGVMGSGWAIAPNTVITNAHVIAGHEETEIQTVDGRVSEATPIAFNPRNDIAVLSVGLDLNPLPLSAGVRRDAEAAVIGYPNDGPLTISPARAGEARTVLADNAYGAGPFERRMVTLRGRVVRGNSGGPMVDASGTVLGTVFAATTEGPPGGLAVPNGIVARIVNQATGPVDTGRCAG
jgi:S1-C subfamily serine protease